MVNLNYNSGTVFEDCELDGQSKVARAISGSSVTVRNCEIHGVGNAIEAEGPNTIILTGPETGAINVGSDADDPAADVLVERNRLAGHPRDRGGG